jgi:hypothetical protein
MNNAVEMVSCSMMYIPSFTGFKEILRFCLRNLRGCNVGITEGRDL